MGYHKRTITKGKFGEFSKIQEEIEEVLDAHEQQHSLLILCELADLIGAIEGYVNTKHDISLNDLIKMKDSTHSAFKEGYRK